ncbi:DMT family transporter [Nostocoides japonicum]|uniref:DMT family transporter n=1 Tax=Nostocoides japonicum TaxID=99481 RepID=UPI00065B8FD5|nr:DMT family transporter [Tetrasphaera japonica]
MGIRFHVTLLGLAASFLLALAAFYQQRAARETTRQGRGVVSGASALMATLVRDRVWLTGWLINLAGFGTQAVALHLGSVAAVQPLLVTQLLFALPMSSLERRTWPTPRDWASAVAICGGLVLLLAVVGVPPLAAAADRGRVVLAVVAALAMIVVLVPLAARSGPPVMVVVTAGCAGLCFALTAVFIKLTAADLVRHGVGYTARDWVGYALAGSTLLGLVLEQTAFANGPLPWAVATKEAVNPIASYALGILAFPAVFPTDAGTLAALAGAGALIVLGAIGLAASPSADVWLTRTEDVHAARG